MSKSLQIRKLLYEFGEYVIEEFDGSAEWPTRDPIERDKETLVMFLHRKNYDVPSQTWHATFDLQPPHQQLSHDLPAIS
jgi:hypothetical protein